MAALRLGLMGFGAIGQDVVAAAAHGRLDGVAIPSALVRRPRGADARAGATELTADPDRFFSHRFDAVLECAGHAAIRDHAGRVFEGGADLVVTSIGAFTDQALLDATLAAAARAGRRLIIASAGIGALDILSAAAVGGLDSAEIVVRKAPVAWKGTPGEHLVDLDALSEPAVLYDGPVRAGARDYPQNVNISAAVALAGMGLDATRLVIVADPTIENHVIEVRARGAFGSFSFVEDIVASPDNPKTGRIVAMAVVKTIRQLRSTLVVGA